MTLTSIQGQMALPIYSAYTWPSFYAIIISISTGMCINYRPICKISIFVTFDLENVLIDPKIYCGNICDPYPITLPKMNPLAYFMAEIGGRQTHRHRQTDRQTNRRNRPLYSCPLRWGNSKYIYFANFSMILWGGGGVRLEHGADLYMSMYSNSASNSRTA